MVESKQSIMLDTWLLYTYIYIHYLCKRKSNITVLSSKVAAYIYIYIIFVNMNE